MTTTQLPGLLPELEVIRADFPILERTLAGAACRWSTPDSANTSQKPQVVIDTMVDHPERQQRQRRPGDAPAGAEASEAFEAARDKVAAFIGAPSRNEVVFTKNATEALNLLARTIDLGPGDNVVITEMEHHSNLVPWQLACERSGAELRWFGLTEDGRLDLSDADRLVDEHTKVVAFTWVSNMLGTVKPGERPGCPGARRGRLLRRRRVAGRAAAAGRRLVRRVRLPGLHRTWVVGPTGVGAVGTRGAAQRAAALPRRRRDDRDRHDGPVDLRPGPHRFEAGTPPIVEAVGLGAAVDYLSHIGMEAIHRHEQTITAYALEGLATVPGLTVLGPLDAAERGERSPFEIEGVHPTA